jgi:hypothetical protein
MRGSIEILLDDIINEETRHKVAEDLIHNYKLPLIMKQILTAFHKLRVYIYADDYDGIRYDNRLFIMETLLNKNIDMFIALVLALNIDLNAHELILLMDRYPSHNTIGASRFNDFAMKILPVYYKLLDYYDFNVSNLDMSDEQKKSIQEYRNYKYSGRMTKSAIK